MMYRKNFARLTVKFLDGDTNEELFEIPNKNVLEISDLFADMYVTEIVKNYLGLENAPDNIIVLVVGQYSK